jgi:hypothetical protein
MADQHQVGGWRSEGGHGGSVVTFPGLLGRDLFGRIDENMAAVLFHGLIIDERAALHK